MIRITQDVCIYDNHEDAQYWVRKGHYATLDEIFVEQIEPDYPQVPPNRFKPEYIAYRPDKGYIVMAVNEDDGFVIKSRYVYIIAK